MYEENARYRNAVFAAINPKLSQTIIPLGRVDSMLRVKRALDEGRMVGILADRMLAEEEGSNAVREFTLLGGRIWIPVGPFRLAAMLRRPVIFIVGLYRGGNRYEVSYEELFDFSEEPEANGAAERAAAIDARINAAMQAYIDRLEHYCRDAPYNWFNFFDYWNDGAKRDTHSAGRAPQRME
jgi:predicted LPLAT superfamily acyltransferase